MAQRQSRKRGSTEVNEAKRLQLSHNFGQKTPSLKDFIKATLYNYPDGSQILKEIIQNADDAGASEVAFLLDYTTHSRESLVNEKLSAHQGQALYAWNDARLTQSDWEGIGGKLGSSVKREETLKVGRFGLGFVSVYHITDLPVILSDDSIGILDPHEYIQSQETGIKFELDNFFQSEDYAGHHDCFVSYFGYDGGASYDGTLFRFPLRNKECNSDIKPNGFYDTNLVMSSLFDPLKKEAENILLFLKTIKSIKLFIKMSLREEPECIFSAHIPSLDHVGRFNVDTLSPHINSCEFRAKIKVYINLFPIVLSNRKENGVWLVLNLVGFPVSPTELSEFYYAHKLCYLPWIGIALETGINIWEISQFAVELNLNCSYDWDGSNLLDFIEKIVSNLKCKFSIPHTYSITPNSGRMFCFLPSPEDSHFPFHLHGYFALSNDRRRIKWPTLDSRDHDSEWNRLLVEELGVSAYAILIQILIHCFHHPNPDKYHYQLLGVGASNPDSLAGILVNQGLAKLMGNKLLYCHSPEQWLDAGSVLYHPSIIHEQLPSEKSIMRVLNVLQQPFVSLPNNLIEIFHSLPSFMSSIENKIISPNRMRDILKECHDIKKLKSLDFHVIDEVLSYIIEDLNLSCSGQNIAKSLENIPLLISEYNEISRFSTNSHNSLYIYAPNLNYIALFPGLENLFVNRNIHSHAYLLKLSRSYSGRINLKDISDIVKEPNILIDLFKLSLNKSFQHSEGPLKWNSNSSTETNWIKSVWSFIGTNLDLAKYLGRLPLLPKESFNSANNQLLPLSANTIYIEKSPTRYTAIQTLLAKSGCTFIHPHRFIECFEGLVLEPLPRGLLLTLRNGDVLNKFVAQLRTHASSTLVCIITSILTSELELTSEQIAIIKQLPIFPNMSGRFISLSNFVVRIPDSFTLPPITYPNHFLSPDDSNMNELYKRLRFPCEDVDNFVNKYLIAFMNELSESRKATEHYRLSQLLLGNLLRFSPRLRSVLKDMNWIVDSNASSVIGNNLVYRSPKELFNPDDDILKRILPSHSRFFPHSAYSSHFHNMKNILNNLSELNDQSLFEAIIEAAIDYFKQSIKKSELDFQVKWKNQFEKLLQFLNICVQPIPRLEVSSVVANAMLSNQIVLPCFQRPSNYPKCLPFKAEKSFYQISSVVFCLEEEIPLIASVRVCVPLCASKSERYQFVQILQHLNCQTELTSEMLIEQMHAICTANIDTSDRLKVHRVLKRIYSSPCLMSDEIDRTLKFIYLKSENTFIHPGSVVQKRFKFNLEPFYYCFETLNYNEDTWRLFEECGASQNITPAKLYGILQQLYSQQARVNSVEIVVNIIEYLYENEFEECELLLGQDCKLHLASECLFYDTNSNSETDQFNVKKDGTLYHIVHFKISVSIAKNLGAKSLKFTLLGDEDKFNFCKSVGQSEDLTTRLKSILNQYASNIDVFKELVQNADDARAMTVRVLFDHSTFPSDSLLDSSMKEWQGPALYFYNDSQFTDQDFANIMKIFGETKRDDLEKIGKFGLGFNTVYHLTDLPSFVSGRYIHVLDPHMKYIAQHFPKPGFSVDFIDNSESLLMYKDQFRVFNLALFNCDVFRKSVYKGTLFRLPFRSKSVKSEISENKFGEREVRELLSHIIDESESVIRFLQHINCIEVFERQNGTSEVKLFSVTKRVNSNPLKYPFLTQYSQHFNNILNGCKVNPILHHQAVTISRERPNIKIDENFIIAYASGTNQCLDYIINARRCANYPFCSILLPISLLNPTNENSEQRKFNLYSFLPLPITSPYHKYYVNGCFELEASRRGITVTEDESEKTRWNQSLINDALVNALIHLLMSVRQYFSNSDKSRISNYYALWPNERFENDILWSEFPRAFAIRVMDSNFPVFHYELGEERWRGYGDVHFILKEDCYGQEQFWDLIKEIALRSNLYLVEIPKEFKNSYAFQVIYSNRTDKVYTLPVICETILFPQIKNLDLKQLKLILLTLLPIVNQAQGGWAKEFLYKSECIPCGTKRDHSLIFPSRVVCSHSVVAELYYPADKRTVHPEFSELMDKKTPYYKALKKLDMVHNILPCEDLIERCECQMNYSPAKRVKYCMTLIGYLNSKLKQSKKNYSEEELGQLLDIEFLPVCANKLLIKLDLQNPIKFASPKQCFPFELRQLIPGHYYALTEEVDKLIESPLNGFLSLDCTSYTIDLEEVVSLLESLYAKENEIIRLNLQELVTPVCERIFCVLFNRWEQISRQESAVDLISPLKERLYVWHPTHRMFSCTSDLVYTHKYENFESKYLMAFPYKLSLDTKLMELFFESLGVRQDILPTDACDIIQKIADDFDGPIPSNEANLVIFLINSFFEEYETSFEETRKCLLLSSKLTLCKPDGLIIDDLYLQGCKGKKSKAEYSGVHQRIHPKCAFNLGARSIRSNLYTEKKFKVIDFGQHEDIAARIESLKEGYPGGINILKELLQNAEDAGATEMSLMLDYHTYSDKTESLCFSELEHPNWSNYQRYPSLLVYNNRPFSEEDLEGIQCVGLGGKKNKNTIGKFGLGFNAVYHLTESPCLLTRNQTGGDITLCVMDPYRKFLRLDSNDLPGIRLDFEDGKLLEFSDQFEPYSLFSKIKNHFPNLTHGEYSIFRIPLMSHDTFTVNKLLSDFLQYSSKLNLFLDSIRNISVYTHGTDGKVSFVGSANTETWNSVSIPSPLNSPNQYVKNINVCFKEISVELSVEQISVEVPSTHLTHTYLGKRSRSKATTFSWLLFNFKGSIEDLECICPKLRDYKSIFEKEKLTHEVFAGVAVEIPQNETCISRKEGPSLFSYLPIGRDEKRNAFPIQVNAPFILDSTRQYIRFTDTSEPSKKEVEWEDVWHSAILEHVITPLFASLLLNLRCPSDHASLNRLTSWKKSESTYYEWYYSLYPNLTNMIKGNNRNHNFHYALSKQLYSLLYNNNEKILIDRMHKEWHYLKESDIADSGVFKCNFSPSECIPSDSPSTSTDEYYRCSVKTPKLSISAENASTGELLSVMSRLKYPITCAPYHVANCFEKFGCEVTRVNQFHFLSFINQHKSNLSKTGNFPMPLFESILTKHEIEMLLTYLLQVTYDKINRYKEIPLKIDYSGKLNVFHKRCNFSLFPNYAELLPYHKEVFISPEFSNSHSEQLSKYGYIRKLESDYLAQHLNSNGFSLEQVSLFWEFILKSKTPSHRIVELFGRHSLVPVRTQIFPLKLTRICNLSFILSRQTYRSKGFIFKSLIKLNCPCLNLENLNSCLSTELEKYLTPLIISDSISPESFLKVVKLSDNHSLQTVHFEGKEAEYLRYLFSSCDFATLEMESIGIIGSLKIFISEAGHLCSLKYFGNCFINKDCVPILPFLEEILQECNLGIFKADMNTLIVSMAKQLKINLINVECLFINYIFPNFTRLDLTEQKHLLNFIYTTIDTIDCTNSNSIVSQLRTLKFIPKPSSSNRFAVSEFYSPAVELFRSFFPHLLLPDQWFDENQGYFDLFCKIGLVHEENLKLVVDAALLVEGGNFLHISDEVSTLLSVLVSLLKSDIPLNSQDESYLTKLASIPFLPVWKIIPSQSEEERALVRFDQANLSKYEYSCCTTSYIHNDHVSQISELDLLNIPSEPQTETVIDHLETISETFSQMLEFHENTLPQIFYATYKYLGENNTEDLVSRFNKTPCLLHDNSLHYPRNMVFSIDTILLRYLFRVPDALVAYRDFLLMVGVEESPTYTHYSSVLNDIKNDEKLDELERKQVSKNTFLLFIESLRKSEALDIKLNLSKTLVLTDKFLIVSIDQVLYLDKTRLKIHMEDFNDLSQFLFLCQLPPTELGSSEPPAVLKLKYVSEIIEESLVNSMVVTSQNNMFLREGKQVELFLKSPEFTKSLFRIYYHETKGQGAGNLGLIRIKNSVARNIEQEPSIDKDPCFKTVFQALQDISVKIVDSIPIIITNRTTNVSLVKRDLYFCFFQDSVLYARSGVISDIGFILDLTYALNIYLGSIFSGVLFDLELCISSHDCTQIMRRLDSYNISPCPYLDDIDFPHLSPGITLTPSNPMASTITQLKPIPSSSSTPSFPTINPSAGITRNILIQILHTSKPRTFPRSKGPITTQDTLTAKLWIRTAQCDLRAAEKLLSRTNQDTSFPPQACANCFECAMKTCIAILYINKFNEANLFCQRNLDILLDLVKEFFPSASYDQFRSHCIPLINFDENAKNPCMTPGIGCCIPMDFISVSTALQAIENASKLLEIVRAEIPVFNQLMFDDAMKTWESPPGSLLMSQLEDFNIHSTQEKELLAYDSDEYCAVALNFFKTLPNAAIKNIFKIHNKNCWDRFVQNVKNNVASSEGAGYDEGSLLIKPLFHGTSRTDPDVIIRDPAGFNIAYSNQGMWGRGLYFAVNASYSDKKYAHVSRDDGTIRSIFLAKVFVGNAKNMKENRGITRPPKGYHSVTGNYRNGNQVYILHKNGLAYPGYLIQYTM